jgi:hypothetical protein
LSEAQAKEFWARKREDGQYIAVSTFLALDWHIYWQDHRKHGEDATISALHCK